MLSYREGDWEWKKLGRLLEKKAKHKEWWDRVDESAEGYQEVN